MNFEDNQRVEALAKQLKDNGIACSIDEAEEKAKSMIVTTETGEKEAPTDIGVLEQRYRFMLQDQEKKFSEEIRKLNSTINDVSCQLHSLKKQFSEKRKEVIENSKEVPKKANDSQETKQQTLEADKPQQQECRKPSGTDQLDPDDFAVEKYFYCGEK